jgi:hypothetical protein
MTLQPPAERDLPAGRQAQMRTALLRTIDGPTAEPARRTGRPTAWRWAAAAAGLAVIAAAGVAALLPYRDDSQTLAYSGGAVSPEVQRAADQCIEDNRAHPDSGTGADLTLVNLLGRNGTAAVVYTSPGGMVYCFNSSQTSGRSMASQAVSNWLPGPIEIGSATSTEAEGPSDYFAVAGRVSGRAARVVLDHGNGLQTTANLAGGTFIVIAEGEVDTIPSTLVTYDGAGAEIDRRAAWAGSLDEQTSCRTDPSGAVIKGSVAGTDCRPGEAWR